MIIGKVIDNYKITAVLGKGGMGVVYKATDMTLDRDVALKMMDSRLASDENFLKRFQSEAKALAKLQNPNIVSIFALRETELGFCIVMEYVEGDTLADRVNAGPMPLDKALKIFKQVLVAFDHAHKAGIIHRDIKPSNVMLTRDDVVKVTDFGLAKIQQPTAMTATMGTGGTLFYMSPEQVRGLANVDHRGDIYSIGMTLYEVLAGQLPFSDDESDFGIRQAIVDGKIPPPDRFNPGIPRPIAKVIMQSIEREPEKRYQSASEFWDALSAVKVEARPQPQATSVSTGESPAPSRSTIGRMPVAIGAGVVVLVVAFFALRGYLTGPGATLSVTTEPPGARVFIDGMEVGTTPLDSADLAEGSIALRVDHEGYFTKDTTVVLRPGTTVALTLALQKVPDQSRATQTDPALPVQSPRQEPTGRPAVQRQEQPVSKGTLVLQAIPRGSISIDGVSKATNTAQAVSVEVEAGERTIVFEHPQYGTKRETVSLKAGERKTLTCYFEGYISVAAQGDANWGTIMINGTNTNKFAPQAKVPLGVGTHRVIVTREGYDTLEGEMVVTIKPELKEVVYPLVFTLRKR